MATGLREMTLEQRRQMVDTEQLWQAWGATRKRNAGYAGSMGWRTSKGREYLVRQVAENGSRRMRSLGPRSIETERVLQQFQDNKATAQADLKKQSSRLGEMARLNRALRLGRVPMASANVARVLDKHGLLGRNILIVGTNAIFAYEAAAGVFVDTSMLATGDLDILFDARVRLRLRSEAEPPTLMSALKAADASFERVTHRSFSAVNSDGFYVDLIKAPPKDIVTSAETDTLGGDNDLHASHVPNMRWVANAPKFSAMAIGADGFPVPLSCPDPRAFALYKLWMGTKDSTREPLKRVRDIEQAKTVAAMVNGHMANLPFEPEHLACFPRRATNLAMDNNFFRLA